MLKLCMGKISPRVSSLPKATLPSVAGDLLSYRGMSLGQVGVCAYFCSLTRYDKVSTCHTLEVKKKKKSMVALKEIY